MRMGAVYRKTFELEPGIPIVCYVKDAKATVQIMRLLEDYRNGVRAAPKYCVDHNCAIRNKKLFPHPVLEVWFIDSRAYVLEKVWKSGSLKGHGSVVRYGHDDGPFIKAVDKGLPILQKERLITLRPLSGTDRIGRNAGDGGGHKKGRPNIPSRKPRQAGLHRGLGARGKTAQRWLMEKRAAAEALV
jgi:hypothetical protein